jgi:hypothetical protein
LNEQDSVLTGQTMYSVAGRLGPAIGVSSTSGFHRLLATKPVSSETSKAERRSSSVHSSIHTPLFQTIRTIVAIFLAKVSLAISGLMPLVSTQTLLQKGHLFILRRLVGSDRDCARLTGNSEVIHLAGKHAFRGSGRSVVGLWVGHSPQCGAPLVVMRPFSCWHESAPSADPKQRSKSFRLTVGQVGQFHGAPKFVNYAKVTT